MNVNESKYYSAKKTVENAIQCAKEELTPLILDGIPDGSYEGMTEASIARNAYNAQMRMKLAEGWSERDEIRDFNPESYGKALARSAVRNAVLPSSFIRVGLTSSVLGDDIVSDLYDLFCELNAYPVTIMNALINGHYYDSMELKMISGSEEVSLEDAYIEEIVAGNKKERVDFLVKFDDTFLTVVKRKAGSTSAESGLIDIPYLTVSRSEFVCTALAYVSAYNGKPYTMYDFIKDQTGLSGEALDKRIEEFTEEECQAAEMAFAYYLSVCIQDLISDQTFFDIISKPDVQMEFELSHYYARLMNLAQVESDLILSKPTNKQVSLRAAAIIGANALFDAAISIIPGGPIFKGAKWAKKAKTAAKISKLTKLKSAISKVKVIKRIKATKQFKATAAVMTKFSKWAKKPMYKNISRGNALKFSLFCANSAATSAMLAGLAYNNGEITEQEAENAVSRVSVPGFDLSHLYRLIKKEVRDLFGVDINLTFNKVMDWIDDILVDDIDVSYDNEVSVSY